MALGTLEPLELATSVFTAPTRNSGIWPYGHGIFSIGSAAVIGWKSFSVCQCIDTAVGETRADLPEWSERTVLPTFNPALSEVVRSLVVLCGLDPTKATIDDMDRVNERFVCCACTRNLLDLVDSGSGRLAVAKEGTPHSHPIVVLSWRNAVRTFRVLDELGVDLTLGILVGPCTGVLRRSLRRAVDVWSSRSGPEYTILP